MSDNNAKNDHSNAQSSPTEADVETTKSAGVSHIENKKIKEYTVATNDGGTTKVTITFVDEDNKQTQETREFDEFSQASAWVAGLEVDTMPENSMQTPSVDDTTKL